MGLPLSLFNVSISKLSKVVLLFFYLVVANYLYSLQQQPSCHDVESSALLQFKESFVIKASASGYFGSYPKVSSWKLAEGETFNCCSWDGVDCDEETGHVIGLDLSSSCLYGSISSNSSLFSLVHLQRLNLADNDFNYSLIPTKIRNLPKLTYLNLSVSVFSGQVPTEVSQLSKLSSLDLSLNIDPFSGENLLKLEASTMKSLVRNFTSLEELDLSWVDISSGVANYMANLSLLTSLNLTNCGMFGEFPARVFRLQNLKILSMRFNQGITGYLPEFNRSSPLMVLELAGTSSSGILPSSFEKLESLNKLDVSECNFSGMVPLSLGNLRQLRYLDLSLNKFNGPIPASLSNLTQLTYLQLSDNNFSSGPYYWLGKQTKLTQLRLVNINLSGYIPSSLCNLTQLTKLDLSYNGLSGPIPSWLANLSRLESIDLGINKLSSSIPKSFFTLRHLNTLYRDGNDLRGSVEILKLQNVTRLQLTGPKLEILLTESRIVNATLPNFTLLKLALCNIKEFPNFLRYQQNLDWLDLSRNKLHGQVPKWFLNTSIETLGFLDLSLNFLSGFDHQNSILLPWLNLIVLRLYSNMLHGPLPIPRPNIIYYAISDNKLDGEISPLICNLSSLQYLVLLNNKLSGMLPQCLGTFSDDLRVLSLGNNSFHGFLPQTYSNTSNLRMIDVSDNKLQGQLPRTLENCVMLEFLVLSNNEFNDVFPFWLGTLPNLKLLAMPHNGFYGVIGKPKKKLHFPELRILDLL
ncbi:unnamed protein product [Prunus armeniaca]